MSLRRPLRALALAALAAVPAHAADLTFGGRSELWYDDNVLGTDKDEISDGELLITPELGLSDRWGTLEGKLNLRPNYELFFDQKDLRGFNYQADGSLAWEPTQRTSVRLDDTFWRYRSLRLLSTAATPGGTPVELGARDRFTRNVAQLVATHRLTPIDVLRLSGGFVLWEFSDARHFDQQTASAALDYQHSLSETIAVGASTSYNRLAIQRLGAIPERDTHYVNLSFTASYVPADTFFVRASVGPTYVRQPRVKQPSLIRGQLYRFSGNDILVGLLPSTCPTLKTGEYFDGPGCNLFGVDPVAQAFFYNQLLQRALDVVPLTGSVPDRDTFTYFADVSLERTWDSASLAISYRRDEGSGSSAGFSTVADTFELRGTLRPRQDLTLSAALAWENRQETQASASYVVILDTVPASGPLPSIGNLVPVGVRSLSGSSFSDAVKTLSLYGSAEYRISARVSLSGAVSWRDQQATRTSQFSDYARFQVMLGFNVELEPLRW